MPVVPPADVTSTVTVPTWWAGVLAVIRVPPVDTATVPAGEVAN